MEDYEGMFEQYIETSIGFLVVYSIEDSHSFVKAQQVIDRIRMMKDEKYKIVLVGNKLDTQKIEVTMEEGQKLANENKIKFIETSCLSGENVENAFKMLVDKCDADQTAVRGGRRVQP
jgi:Ras-related protein Rab-18